METVNNSFTLSVYNTLTHKKEEVEVSEQVYTAYRRTGWQLENNDRSFYAHEIQMSSLIGGEDGAYENFREFLSDEENPEKIVEKEMLRSALCKALNCLSEAERELIQAIYFDGLTEREYADRLGVYRNAIHKRKIRILSKIKEILES